MGDILYPLRASGIAVGDSYGDGKPDIVAPTGFGTNRSQRACPAWRSFYRGIVTEVRIQLFVTGGTFDKEYNELTGELFFKHTHVSEMLQLGRCRLDAAADKDYHHPGRHSPRSTRHSAIFAPLAISP